jgi:hypothetical protein
MVVGKTPATLPLRSREGLPSLQDAGSKALLPRNCMQSPPIARADNGVGGTNWDVCIIAALDAPLEVARGQADLYQRGERLEEWRVDLYSQQRRTRITRMMCECGDGAQAS